MVPLYVPQLVQEAHQARPRGQKSQRFRLPVPEVRKSRIPMFPHLHKEHNRAFHLEELFRRGISHKVHIFKLMLKFSLSVFLQWVRLLIFYFRTLANHWQVEAHNLLVASGLARKYKVGRRVDDTGDCGFDALLAQLEDPRIRATIDPIVWRGITSIQGSYFTFYIFSNNKKAYLHLLKI